MAERRKDSKGRVLKLGESQRKDGVYQFRYKDGMHRWKYVYDTSLQELREKEKQILQDLQDGIDYVGGQITVLQLITRYISLKQGVRHNTKVGYNFVRNVVAREAFGQRIVYDLRMSDAKAWCIELHNKGYSFSTIDAIGGVMRPAFKMAVDEDIIRKSPFNFSLSEVLAKDTVHRKALTPQELKSFLEYVKSDTCASKYYDMLIILLYTGMRISDLCGLIVSDINFSEETVLVERQLMRTRNADYYIEKPKTHSGYREIPFINDEVKEAFLRVIANRKTPDIEPMVDGVTGFLFIDINDKPKIAMHFEHALKRIVDNYNAKHDEQIALTPHVLRHTFCTNLADSIPPKSLQYLMGHSDVSTTLGIYAHENFNAAKAAVKDCKNKHFTA